MKKFSAIVLTVVLCLSAVVALVGCGPKAALPNFEVPEGGYDGSDVTITFWHTMGQNLSNVLDIYIEEFNKLYPNIHVSWEKIGGYDDVRDQIKTKITVGEQPNLAYCYPDHVALYNVSGAVATLDNLISSTYETKRNDKKNPTEILGLTDAQKNDFIQGYYSEGSSFGDGLMYTLPLSKSTEVMYYNKTFFDKNNIPVPDHWFSTDENDKTSLEAVCAKIKSIDKYSIPLGYDSEANWFITMCEQLGSPYTEVDANGNGSFLFDNETNRNFIKKFNEWYAKGYLTTQKLYGSYTSGLFVNEPKAAPNATKEDGTPIIRSYISIGSSAGATHQTPATDTFEVGIAEIPQADKNNQKVISQGPSVCIFKKDNPQEVVASWIFLKYLTTTPEFQAEFSIASGYVPVIKSVMKNAVFAKHIESADGYTHLAALSTKVCMAQEQAYYTSPAFNGSSKARDQVGALLAKCLGLSGDIDKQIKDAFAAAIEECEFAAD